MTEDESPRTPDATSDEGLGVGIGAGEPNTFEPEEDPDAAAEPDSQ